MQGGRVSRGSKSGCDPPHDVRIPLSLAVWWVDRRLNRVASCFTSLWVQFYGLPFLRKTTKNAARHSGRRTRGQCARNGRTRLSAAPICLARRAMPDACRRTSRTVYGTGHTRSPLSKEKPADTNAAGKESSSIVRVLASQGDEIALSYALNRHRLFDQLVVSPRLRGSNPYPCGSLTYRFPVPV